MCELPPTRLTRAIMSFFAALCSPLRRGFIAAALLISSPAVFCQDYSFSRFQVPGSWVVFPYDINNNGQVVGWFQSLVGYNGFLRHADGTFETFTAPWLSSPFYSTFTFGVNDSGVVVGSGGCIGFIRTPNGAMTQVGVAGECVTLYGINELGRSVGSMYNVTTNVVRAFVREPNGTILFPSIPLIAPATPAYFFAINDREEIVGTTLSGQIFQFNYATGSAKLTAVRAGFEKYDLNNNGEITGGGYLYRSDGTQAPQIIEPSGAYFAPIGINDVGDMVGRYDPYAVIAKAGCDAERSALIAEYVNALLPFTPKCSDLTQDAHTAFFSFNELNTGNYSWALLSPPFLASADSGYGLDKWRIEFGGARTVNSAYRNPVRNADVNGTPQSRHMFGDAADLKNVSGAPKEYRAMVSAARRAKADYIEPTTLPCGIACVHADWRAHDGGFFWQPKPTKSGQK